jgi:hypothetical protein
MDSQRRNMSQQICNSAALSIGSTAETLTNHAASPVQPERCRRGRIVAVCLVAGLLALHGCGGGSSGGGTTAIPSGASSSVEHWNHIAIDASGLDHTTGYGEQFGPTRASRALAIVQIAVFDAVNAIAGGYQSYTGLAPAPGASMTAAIAQAAHDTLAALFTLQRATFDQHLAGELATIAGGKAKTDGIAVGQQAAAAILALRDPTKDGSGIPEPHIGVDYTTSNDPGKWREDPISQKTIA